METKVSDLTVDQLREIISGIVQEKFEDLIEDVKSMLDKDYVDSIKESRAEYKQGKTTSIDDIMKQDV